MVDQTPKKRLDMLVQRQLDTISTGNGAYLETFLRVVKQAGLKTRVIFAPRHSFGNRPWANIHPRLDNLIDEAVWPRTIKIGRHYWSMSPIVWRRFIVRAFKHLMIKAGVSMMIPSYLGRPLALSEEKAVAKVSNQDVGDITIAEYSSMGPVLKRITAETRKGVLMHDLLSDRGKIWREKSFEPDLYQVSTEEESDWCAESDLMIYASANEMEKFGPTIPAAQNVWLRPEPPAYGESTGAGPARVVFIGTTHAGNTDALSHFLSDIWPLVRAKAPDLEFWVVGSVGKGLTEEERAQPGLKVLGRVDKLEDIGGASSIGVAPTRLATGISIKVAEYLMLNMTCIAYPLALEGFQTALNENVTLADTPEGFADEILKLVSNTCERAQQASLNRTQAQDILDNQEVKDFLLSALAPAS